MKLRSRRLVQCAARVISLAARAVMTTVCVEEVEHSPKTSPYHPTDEQFLYCLWHDGLYAAIFSGKCTKLAALVSQHEDGSYVADALESVGIRPIRGSSRHGGAAALKQMMDLAKDAHITIATDGPRGPRRVVKEGIVYLASKTGRRIVPVASAASRAWKPRGRWTDLVVPKPFSRVVIAAGKPLSVPPDQSREQLEQYRVMLQERMDELQQQVDEKVRLGSASESPPATDGAHTARRAA